MGLPAPAEHLLQANVPHRCDPIVTIAVQMLGQVLQSRKPTQKERQYWSPPPLRRSDQASSPFANHSHYTYTHPLLTPWLHFRQEKKNKMNRKRYLTGRCTKQYWSVLRPPAARAPRTTWCAPPRQNAAPPRKAAGSQRSPESLAHSRKERHQEDCSNFCEQRRVRGNGPWPRRGVIVFVYFCSKASAWCSGTRWRVTETCF